MIRKNHLPSKDEHDKDSRRKIKRVITNNYIGNPPSITRNLEEAGIVQKTEGQVRDTDFPLLPSIDDLTDNIQTAIVGTIATITVALDNPEAQFHRLKLDDDTGTLTDFIIDLTGLAKNKAVEFITDIQTVFTGTPTITWCLNGTPITVDGLPSDFGDTGTKEFKMDISAIDTPIVTSVEVLNGSGTGLSEPIILTIHTVSPQTLPTLSTIDWSKNPSHITLDRDVSFFFSNLPASGKYEGVLVIIDVDATGGYAAPIWPASMINAPVVPTTANTRTSVMLYTIDGGTVVTHATSVGSSSGGNSVPDGTAQYQHLEWNGSGWINQQILTFGALASDSGNIRFPNNNVGIAWRNAANTNNSRFYLDGNDDMILDEANSFQIRSVITGASGVANFVSYRNDPTPTTGDELGSLRFDGEDDAGDTTQYARILGGIADVVDGSEDGLLQLEVAIAGALTAFIRLNQSNFGTVHFLKTQTFGTNPADDGNVNFPNNAIGTSWRNAANTGNVGINVDANDDMILDEVDNLQVTNTTTGASGIANIVSYRNDASPTNGDELGSIRFDGNNNAVAQKQYARILAGIADVVAGSEDGQMLIQVAEAGSLVSYMGLNLLNTGTLDVYKDLHMNAKKIDFDQDSDTSIRASTDDELQIEIGGSDVLQIVAAGGLNWNLSGVGHSISAGSTTFTTTLGAITDDYIVKWDTNNQFIFTPNHIDTRSSTVPYIFESIYSQATPADDTTIALYQWNYKNDIGTIEPHAQLQLITTDVTDGSEDCDWVFEEMVGGVMTEMIRIDANLNEVRFGNGSDLDLQAGDIDNFTQLNADAGAKATITGSRGGNAALASLLSALETYGMINDSTT